MNEVMQSVLRSQIFKWFVVLLVGCLGLALRQFAVKGAVDLQALAAHVADALDVLAAGGLFGWALLERPNLMRGPARPPLDEERLE